MQELYDYCYAISGGIEQHDLAEEVRLALEGNEHFMLAYTLWKNGFSVMPLLEDGKRPAVRWKRYQTERCTFRDLIGWFIGHNYRPAIVTGELSGITIVDCDSAEAIEAWEQSGEYTSVMQATKRGRHYVYAHNGERNTVRMNGVSGVDRRGEGGYVKAYAHSINWQRSDITAFIECIY